ncbi:MAG TPA: hypothetical protein VF128_15760 [Gemmatimonadaceae bacterium]
MSTRFRRAFIVVLGLGVLACGDDGPTGPKATEIRLNLVSLSLEQLDSAQLIPSVVDAGGTLISGIPVTFESTAPTVVSVSSIGVVKSLGPAGSGEIRVKGGGLTRMVPVTVTAVADSLVVSPNPLVVPQLGTVQINAKVIDRAGANVPQAPITFFVSDSTLVTVSSSGSVKSVGPAGLASITVSSPGFAAIVPVAVTQVPTKLAVTPVDPKVAQGRTLRLVATVLDAVNVAVQGAVFQYTSLTPALVSVSSDGVVTSLGPLGNAMVRVAALGIPLSVDVAIGVVDFGSPTGDSLQVIGSPLMYAVDFIDNETLVAASYANNARLFNLRTNSSSAIGVPASYGVAVSALRNRAHFASNVFIEYDLATQAQRNLTLQGQLFDVVITADERFAYVGTSAGFIHVVDLPTMTVTRQLQAPRGALHLALSPSGTKIYASSDGEITETDVASGTVRILPTGGLGVQALALTRDGQTLYGVSESGAVIALELATQQRRTFLTPGCRGWGMAISPDDEKLVVSCPQDGRVALFEARTGNLLRTFQGIGEPRRVSMSANGYVAAVGTAGGVAIIR